MKTKLFILSVWFCTSSVFSQNKAPDFGGTDVNGNIVKLSELSDKLVYLDFWASWCKPCKESFPFMSELHEKYSGDGLTIIAVNVDSDQAKMTTFLNGLGSETEFIVLYDKDNKIVESYNIEYLPTSFFIYKGEILSTHVGFKSGDKSKIESEIKLLLEKIKE